MANKRMFCLDIVDTDLFLEMPPSSQALYFQLGMRADDDGFVSSPKKITKITNCGNDDLRLLAAKGYIIPFDSGTIVVTHWNINNNKIKGDRYKPTIYTREKALLSQSNGTYYISGSRMSPECLQSGDTLEPQSRIDKDRKDKDIYCVHFEELWKVYPRKKEKSAAYKAYKATLNKGFSEDELMTAVKRYAEECKKEQRDSRYIKLCSTFLGPNTPFMDYLNQNEEEGNHASVADFYSQFTDLEG